MNLDLDVAKYTVFTKDVAEMKTKICEIATDVTSKPSPDTDGRVNVARERPNPICTRWKTWSDSLIFYYLQM